jgi:uncharacterized membrane protein
MNNLDKPGRALFGISFAGFGVQYFVYGRFVGGLLPGPPWTPGAPITTYLLGAGLIAAGVSIAANSNARLAATLLGILLFVCVLLMFIATPSAILHQGTARTRALEPLALCGAAWMSAGSLPPERPNSQAWDAATDEFAKAGRFIFGLSAIVFGIQHFMYGEFIAMLVPSWIPWHLFWAYFFGLAFIAAGIAIVINVRARLGATLLGFMFLLWVVVLHLPLVVSQPRNGDKWSSLFVAIAMCGSCFIVAAAMSKRTFATITSPIR